MNNSTSIPYTRALLIFLPLFFLSATATAPSPLLVETCKRTSDYALCIGSLSSDPQTAQARSVRTLALLEIVNIMGQTDATLDIISSLVFKVKDPNLAHSIGLCAAAFQDIAGERTWGAIASLKSGDYGGVEGQLGGIKSGVQGCLGQFQDKQPFTDAAKLVGRLTDVDIGIVKLLH